MTDLPLSVLEPLVSRLCVSHCWVVRNGKPQHIKEALTESKLARHLAGGPRYGACPIAPGESTTRVALLDLDSHKGEVPWCDMADAADEIVQAAEEKGLRPTPFRSSGGAGMHLYFLWDAPQDAFSVRHVLKDLLAECDFMVGTGGVGKREIEVFPKQDSVSIDGSGNMFVLPFAGESTPLDPIDLCALPREWGLTMSWPVSSPVAIRVQEPSLACAREMSSVSVELEQLREALAFIPNTGADELNYDDWLGIIFGVHHVTGGSAEGLVLAHEFSARSSKHNPEFLDTRVWPYVKRGANAPQVTGATVLAMAREYGYGAPSADEFEVVAAPTEAPAGRPKYNRDKQGRIDGTAEDFKAALSTPDECGARIRFDEFRDEITVAWEDDPVWRPFADEDYTRLQIRLSQIGFKKTTRDTVRDTVRLVAKENRFDSAQEWLRRLEWDGVDRIGSFLVTYMGAEDTPYTRAVSRYMWTALAGRVLSPGCEAPMVPALIGEQGRGKSRTVKAMAPAAEFYAELNLADRDADASRLMRGTLVIELGELRGLRTRDAESIKTFISRTHEKWTPKFVEFAIELPRRCLFIGTTNEEEFLGDSTGERRWLPVRVGHCYPARVAADVQQLWAQARDTYERAGIAWENAETLAKAVHAEHKISDPWQEAVEQWLAQPGELGEESPSTREFLHVSEVLVSAIGMEKKNIKKEHEMRIGKILHVLGYKRERLMRNGVRRWVWARAN